MTGAVALPWHLPRQVLAVVLPLLSSGSGATLTDKDVGILIFVGVFVAVLTVGMIPTFVAFGRHHPNRWLILLVNLFFGATGVGWLGTLIWACDAIDRSDADARERPNRPAEDWDGQPEPLVQRTTLPFENLQRLKTLLDQGALTVDEYETLKRRLLK